MYIAVQFESVNIGNDRVIFKPIGLIKGDYDSDNQNFVDIYGYEYETINKYDAYNDRYFGCAMTMEQLKEVYFGNYTEDEILSEFLITVMDTYYIGFFDYEKEDINLLEIDFMELEATFSKMNSEKDFRIPVEFHLQGDERFVFDKSGLNKLKKCENIEDIRTIIDDLIATSKQLKEQNQALPQNQTLPQTQTQKKISLKKAESKKFNLAKLRKEVLSNIIGQDEAVYDLTRTIAINQTSMDSRNKSHILITGPSGTGKTEMVNIIAKSLDLPVFIADATAYTKSGYVGKDVYSMLTGLLETANDDLEKAQNGILIIDEIDKKSSNSKDDVSGKGVLLSMLKILDRGIIELDLDQYEYNKVMFDTSNLTIILMGSFDELYEEKQKYNKSIGFSSEGTEEVNKVRIDEEDLVKWLGPEFVGRIGTITSTNELKLQDVLKILRKSKISQLNIIKQDLANRGIKLMYTRGYLEEIAKRGSSRKLGVRKLNKTVKNSLTYAYDEILQNPKHKVLKLTKATALDSRNYFLE